MSRKQIAYLNLSHTREKDLRAATEEVINAYNQYELPRYWGSGSTASVDGTRSDRKDINSIVFFKPDGRSVYPHIDSLFSESMNYVLITDNYKEMLRVAVSVSEGKVSASTIIRRLGSNSIRNSLFYVFREPGRVMRTQFLLQYISEIELREWRMRLRAKAKNLTNSSSGYSSTTMA